MKYILMILSIVALIGNFEVLCGKKKQSVNDRSDQDIDPVSSWLSFVKQSAKRTKVDKKAERKERRVQPVPLGSRGPPGPRGPAGPPGAIVTEAAMMAEFRSLVRDTADRRAARFAGQPLGLMAAGVPDVISAFYIQLQSDVVLYKKSKLELQSFKVQSGGTFIRGQGVELESGRFLAPYTAIYRFHATIHVHKPKDVSLKPRDSIMAMICVNNDCSGNVALKYRSGLSSNSRMFTVTVSGMLYLMANQYTSLLVENFSSNTLTISRDTSFSGSLIGA